MGQPTLPYVDINAKNNPDVVADWIMRNVPSFVGRVPHQWTEAVITKLQQAYVRSHVIREAFKKTRIKGMDFEAPTGYDFMLLKEIFPVPAPPSTYRSPDVPPPPTMGRPPNPNDWTPLRFHELAGRLEDQYVRARMKGDPQMMEAILAAFLQFVWEYAKIKAKTKEMQNNTKVSEWEEFNASVSEAYSRAYNLSSNVMRLTKQDIITLRYSPAPDFTRLVRLRMPQNARGGPGEGEGEGEAD